jgi:hypothetical protein
MLDHQEPGELLAELRQALADHFEARHDLANVTGAGEFTPAVR